MENRIKIMIKGCLILAILLSSQILQGQDVQAKADTLSFFEKIPMFKKDVYVMKATDLPYNGTAFYKNKKWLAINPGKHKEAFIETTFPYPTGNYDVIFSGVGEYDGNSEYYLFVNGKQVLQFMVPPSKHSNEEGMNFSKLESGVTISKGDAIKVLAKVGPVNSI